MGEGGTDDATACGRRAPARGSILGALGRRRTDRGVAARAAPRLLRAGGAGGCHRSDRVSLRRWRSGTRAPAAADERDRVDARPPGRPDGLEPLRSRVRGRRAHPGDRARERDLRAAVGARGAGDVEARCDSGPDGRLDRGRPTPRHRAGLRGSLGERGNARPAGSGRRRRHDERHRARRDRRSGGSSSAGGHSRRAAGAVVGPRIGGFGRCGERSACGGSRGADLRAIRRYDGRRGSRPDPLGDGDEQPERSREQRCCTRPGARPTGWRRSAACRLAGRSARGRR